MRAAHHDFISMKYSLFVDIVHAARMQDLANCDRRTIQMILFKPSYVCQSSQNEIDTEIK